MGHSTRLGVSFVISVPCYVGKYTIYYHLLWLLINIILTSYSRHRDWFNFNLKNNWECALIIRIMNGTSTYVTRTPCHKACPNLVEWPILEPTSMWYSLWKLPQQLMKMTQKSTENLCWWKCIFCHKLLRGPNGLSRFRWINNFNFKLFFPWEQFKLHENYWRKGSLQGDQPTAEYVIQTLAGIQSIRIRAKYNTVSWNLVLFPILWMKMLKLKIKTCQLYFC